MIIIIKYALPLQQREIKQPSHLMTSVSLRRWSWIHKWSSLVCTVFMLLLSLTGLPLIFHHQIGHLLGTEVEAAPLPAGTPRDSLDRVIDVATAR
jgi:uncharacterized iron-regulated membrane protein